MDSFSDRQMHVPQAMWYLATFSALLLLANTAHGAPPQSAPKVGEEHEISKRYEATEETSDGSSGSSRGRDVLSERVIAVRDDGVELEYDLPKAATAEDRARSWQFPVRVFKPNQGSMQLLNGREMESRVDGWLKAGGWTRAACGHWIFTWNAFLIECDPQSVIKTLEAFDLRSAVGEGAAYHDSEARGTGTLTRKTVGPNGATFTVVMEIDPDAVRRAHAGSDVMLGEIMQKPVTLEAALRKRANEAVTGTLSVTIDTDPAGNTRSRTKVTKVETKGLDGRTETRTVTETVERHPVSERRVRP